MNEPTNPFRVPGTTISKEMRKAYGILENALRKGSIMHSFLSGGGLRVIRLEKPRHGNLTGYGEHPYVEEALRHAAEDFAAGGRSYAKVYGDGGLYPCYLTGASSPDGALDAWIRRGYTFDARFVDDLFEVDLRGWKHLDIPDGVDERAREGEVVTWSDDRGCSFKSGPQRFANGEKGSVTELVSKPGGMGSHRAWMWPTSQVARATALEEAFAGALTATPVEAPDE